MDETLYLNALKLKEALENNKEVKLLLELENKLIENERLSPLLKEFQSLQNELNNKLQIYDVDSLEIRKLRQALAQVKYILDTEPEIVIYNNQFKIVNAIYKNISQELFGAFSENKGHKCC